MLSALEAKTFQMLTQIRWRAEGTDPEAGRKTPLLEAAYDRIEALDDILFGEAEPCAAIAPGRTFTGLPDRIGIVVYFASRLVSMREDPASLVFLDQQR
jgi:hypothetical protein